MNATAHAAKAMEAVHARLVEWAREVVAEAGQPGLSIAGRLLDESVVAPHLVLLPYRLGPWPKMVEQTNGIALLGQGRLDRDTWATVPDHWRELAERMGAGLDAVWPKVGGNTPRQHHPLGLAPLDRLPRGLADWYASQPHDSVWTVRTQAQPQALLPSLTWRPPLTIRVYYLVLASEPLATAEDERTMSPSLPGLAAITLAINLQRTVRVTLPALPCEPELLAWLRALAGDVDGADGARLLHLVDWVAQPSANRIGVLPIPDPPADDLAMVMRSLRRPVQAAVHFAVHLPLGAGPLFLPTATPQVSTAQAPRDGGG